MQLLSLLSLLPLALALPSPVKRQSPSCGAQEWNIQQFTAFAAGPTSPAGGPSIFGFDHISFYFDDPNFNNLRSQCERSIEPGTGQLADGKLYPCGNDMYFKYFGSSVELREIGAKCNNATFTETGATGLSLNCYNLFGGKQCETVTQVSVPVSFLEQSGPARV